MHACCFLYSKVGVVLSFIEVGIYLLKLYMGKLQDGQFVRPSDSAYDQVLDSLALVARHMPVPLLEGLLRWRDTCVILSF